MRIALAMARRGLGRVSPNPAVGAVVVGGVDALPEVIARGWTMPGGRPHAETVALDKAGERSRGATLYVTLEPCSHQGQTPPCTDAIIEAEVSRVVCGITDPDPRVAGEGLERLRAAGIAVATGVLAEEAARVTRGHVLRVTERRPHVTMKLAVGADGLVAPGDGAPVWVTGPQARAQGHLLRARNDAILVGRGTVAADDPDLTCRLPGLADRSPVRVVLDTQGRLPATAGMLQNTNKAAVWIMHDRVASGAGLAEVSGVSLIGVPSGDDGRLDIADMLVALAERGITRLLVEGGPMVAGSFLRADVVDEIVLFRGAEAVGETGLMPFADAGLDLLDGDNAFRVKETRQLGRDQMLVYGKIN